MNKPIMAVGRTGCLLACVVLLASSLSAQNTVVNGRVIDPQGNAVPGATATFESHGKVFGAFLCGANGTFEANGISSVNSR
jgi:hypothetical protein